MTIDELAGGCLVQLHLHTSDGSRCGVSDGGEMARACKSAGYDLIAITDHFMNANINCKPTDPWEEKVRILMSGYRAALKVGEEIGLTVIPGWETRSPDPDPTRSPAPELLTYGLDEEFLLANPDIADVPYYEYIDRVLKANGKIVHAHPYRREKYIPEDFKPDPTSVEAYEVYNAGNREPIYNRLALEEAEKYHLLQFAGSDAHRADSVRGGAMWFPEKVNDIESIFEAVRQGKSRIVENLPPLVGALKR